MNVLESVTNRGSFNVMRKFPEAAAQAEPERVLNSLSAHVKKAWERNKWAKREVEEELLRCRRQRNGQYDPDVLTKIRAEGGSEVFLNLTSPKCRALGAWLREFLLSDERNFGFEPTPIPALNAEQEAFVKSVVIQGVHEAGLRGVIPSPVDVAKTLRRVEEKFKLALYEKAQAIAKKMEDKCADQMAEGGWRRAMDGFIEDLTTFPTAFLRGPMPRSRKALKWAQAGRQWTTVVSKVIRLEWDRVSPFDIYPSANGQSTDEGDLLERYPLSRREILAFKDVPGFDNDVINSILEGHPNGYRLNDINDQARVEAENRSDDYRMETNYYDCLLYWGDISGKMLAEWGLNVPDEHDEYPIAAFMIDSQVFGVMLNDDPLGRRNYFAASFEMVPDSVWGKGPPQVLRDCQQMVNSGARALANNMGLAAGPIVEWNIDRLPENEPVGIWAWRQIQTLNDPTGGSSPAVRFYQPSSHAQEILGVIQHWYQYADEVTGIPRYIQGQAKNVGGAGDTASGLSMLMGAAAKGLRQVLGNVDNYVIIPMLERQYMYNMRYDPDPSIKGDLQPVARGTTALLTRETMQQKLMAYAAAKANPIDAPIMGMKGRLALNREEARALNLPVDDIWPEEEDLLAQNMGSPMQGGQPPGVPPGVQPGPLPTKGGNSNGAV